MLTCTDCCASALTPCILIKGLQCGVLSFRISPFDTLQSTGDLLQCPKANLILHFLKMTKAQTY